MEPYTVVATSCRRFDLLEPSLRSLLAHLDGPLAEVIVIEDSEREEVRDVVRAVSPDVRVIVNGRQLGQIVSIDKAYAEVRTPYVFHMQDDWEFFRGGFIAPSYAILAHYPKVSLVGLRARAELHRKVRDFPAERLDGVEFFLMDPRWHPERGGYSFNPGLRRLRDWRDIGPFVRVGREDDISYAFKKRGFRYANLEEPACRHIGGRRHIDDPRFPRRARTMPQRLESSARKRWKRLKRRLAEARGA